MSKGRRPRRAASSPGPNEDASPAVADWLYLATVDDLQNLVATSDAAPSRYEYLRMSALLRKLLADQPRLVDLANRERRLKIVFRAHQYRAPRQPSTTFVETHGDSLVPGADDTPVVELTRESFLRHRIGTVNGQPFTVREVIRFAAHVEGGVHAGSPSTEAERVLGNLSYAFLAADAPWEIIRGMPAGMMLPISKVTLDALTPLTEAVRESS